MTSLADELPEPAQHTEPPQEANSPDLDQARSNHLHDLRIRRDALRHELDEMERLETVQGFSGGRRGGVYTVEEVRLLIRELKNRLKVEKAGGSKKHGPVSPLLLAFVVLPLATDFTLVALFLAVVFNVRLDAPGETPVEFLVTMVFALIITVGVALALRWTAIRRRSYKTDEGTYRAAASDGFARFEMPVIMLLLAGLAGVMLVRIVTDGADAGVAIEATWVIAIFLAFITAALNWTIFMIEFSNGSDETHELDHWGHQLKPIEKRCKDVSRQLASIESQLLRLGGTVPPSSRTGAEEPQPGGSPVTRLPR